MQRKGKKMKASAIKNCKHCGQPVMVIEWGIYRKVLVDAESVNVRPDPHGEEYVRIDGSKVRGFAVPIDEPNTEPAYCPHARSCGLET